MLDARDLIEMKKMIASAAVIQSGGFAEELKKIEKATADLNARMLTVKTLEEADKIKAAAELQKEANENAKKELEANNAALAVRRAKVSEEEGKMKAAAAKQQEVEERFKSQQQAEEKRLQDKLAKLSAAESVLAAREGDLHAQEQKLAQDRRRLDETRKQFAAIKVA